MVVGARPTRLKFAGANVTPSCIMPAIARLEASIAACLALPSAHTTVGNSLLSECITLSCLNLF